MAQIESDLIKAYEAAQEQEDALNQEMVKRSAEMNRLAHDKLITQRLTIWNIAGIDSDFIDPVGGLTLISCTFAVDNFNAVDNTLSFFVRVVVNDYGISNALLDVRDFIDRNVTRGGACFGGHYLYDFLAQDALTFLNKTAALEDKQYISLNRLSGVAPARELLRATLGAMIHNLKEAAANFDATLSDFEAAAERAEKAYAEKQARIRELEKKAGLHHAD